MASERIGAGLRVGGRGGLSVLGEFRAFLLHGNVVDLAVGVVVGVAFSGVVTALVKDLITPLIAAIGAEPNFGTLAVQLNRSRILYGDFINALLSFLIVAAVVFFFVILPVNRLVRIAERGRQPAPPSTRECPECLSRVPLRARRCAFCTSPIAPEQPTAAG
jgi:large conductance mechanosensitive channel